jgi:biotin carboxyl carrier protein
MLERIVHVAMPGRPPSFSDRNISPVTLKGSGPSEPSPQDPEDILARALGLSAEPQPHADTRERPDASAVISYREPGLGPEIKPASYTRELRPEPAAASRKPERETHAISGSRELRRESRADPSSYRLRTEARSHAEARPLGQRHSIQVAENIWVDADLTSPCIDLRAAAEDPLPQSAEDLSSRRSNYDDWTAADRTEPSSSWLYVAFGGLFLLGALLAGAWPLRVPSVTRGAFTHYVGARTELSYGEGEVTGIHVQVGQRVQAGDPLIALGSSADEAAIQDSDLRLAELTAQLEQLQRTRPPIVADNAEPPAPDEEMQRLEETLEAERTKHGELAIRIEHAVVRTAEAGLLEQLAVNVGDAVHIGDAVARIVPASAPVTLAATLRTREARALKVGQAVMLVLEPSLLTAALRVDARIRRISHARASAKRPKREDSIELALSDPNRVPEVMARLASRHDVRIHYSRECTLFSLVGSLLQP